jgi:DNA-binding NarL/FixJ family response regulator
LTVLEEFAPVAGRPVTIMVLSDRAAVHAAWRAMLACEPGVEIKGVPVTDASCVAACVRRHQPGLVLLDMCLLDGLDAQSLRSIQAQCPRMRVLLLGDEAGPAAAVNVLRHRFNGFLSTACPREVCLKAIRAVIRGELWLSRSAMAHAIAGLMEPSRPVDAGASDDGLRADAFEALTPREVQVVALVRRGCINKEIAQQLGIMEDTVKKHLQSVFAKLGVHRRALVALREPARLPSQLHALHAPGADAQRNRSGGWLRSTAAAPLQAGFRPR